MFGPLHSFPVFSQGSKYGSLSVDGIKSVEKYTRIADLRPILTQRVHVRVWYRRAPLQDSYILTLELMYLLKSYKDLSLTVQAPT